MDSKDGDLVSLEEIKSAYEVLKNGPPELYRRTPMSNRVEGLFGLQADGIQLYLKHENAQVTGSFKVRGTTIAFSKLPEGLGTEERKLVTMSAGNFGKAFANLLQYSGRKGLVLLPTTAPENRTEIIRSYGVEVERLPTSELREGVERHCKEDGMYFLHPFDDPGLLAGNASLGLEILEDVSDPDIVLVCCGGGCMLAGTAAAIKLTGHKNCRVYGVEPEGSRTMYESFKAGHAVTMEVSSVAAGLSPPFAGKSCYRHCREYVDGILLVSDQEIVDTMFRLYRSGILVEPSGAAAVTALLHGKVPDSKGKKIVAVLSGGNVTPEELVQLKHKFMST